MEQQLVLSIDQSTSGTKVLLVNNKGQIVTKEFVKHRQIYPLAGWVEHDPMEIYTNVKTLIIRLLEQHQTEVRNIKVLSITNQRETVVIWDKNTGVPIYNAIVWQCRRTADLCKSLKDQGKESIIKQKTGLTLDPYFSATKIKWILDHVEGARAKAIQGDLVMGTIDTWLIWNLTQGAIHATDYTNASRTLLFNIHLQHWDEELLHIFDIPRSMLPMVHSSNDVFGYTTDLGFVNIPISGVIGDSQGALFGQNCFKSGMVKATYGTGTSVLMHTGKDAVTSKNGLVTSIAWGLSGSVDYALEGIIHSTGDTLKWVRDNLGLISDFDEAERQAGSVMDNGGVYFVPAFLGLGAPYWDPLARAAIVGINRSTTKAHIIRASIESIAYQTKDVIELMQQETNIPLQLIRVDGGASNNGFLMQFQADLIGVKIIRSDVAELSAMGSAYLAGLAVGVWEDINEILRLYSETTVFKPNVETERGMDQYTKWKDSIAMILSHL